MISAALPEVAGRLARRLGEIDGVAAVVLGGSHARGVARPDSDIDLGLYYHAASPPAVAALRAFAADVDNRRSGDLMTECGEWGPWANGGGWLIVDGQQVDVLYREIERVAGVIADCRAGRVTCDYYLGHPHGFHNHIYAGEVHSSLPLFDPGNAMGALKVLVAVYPAAMRRAIVRRYLYDARFMLELAAKPAARRDVFHVSGCLFRVAAALVQVLYALNERYFLNEKGALAEVATFAVKPPRFAATIEGVLGWPGMTPPRLMESLERMARLVAQAEALCVGAGLA